MKVPAKRMDEIKARIIRHLSKRKEETVYLLTVAVVTVEIRVSILTAMVTEQVRAPSELYPCENLKVV